MTILLGIEILVKVDRGQAGPASTVRRRRDVFLILGEAWIGHVEASKSSSSGSVPHNNFELRDDD